MSANKNLGGLDIKDLRRFNLALIRKWVLRVLHEPSRLWVRVLKSKYGDVPECFNLGERRRGLSRVRGRSRSSISGWWKDIFDIFVGKEVRGIMDELVWAVGSGDKCKLG